MSCSVGMLNLRVMWMTVIACSIQGCLQHATVAQEMPPSVSEPLLPPEVPQLMPESGYEPAPIIADPEPMGAGYRSSHSGAYRPPVRRAEMVARQENEISSDAGLSDPLGGAASAFGLDGGQGVPMRPSVSGSLAERELQRLTARAERQASLGHYNIKIGPVPFTFGAGVEFHFSDNVNLTRKGKVADLSIVPHLDIYGGIRLSRINTLSIQLGLGYIWNLNRPELDRALTNASVGLDSDTGLSFDIEVGNFRINLHERPAIPRQQFDLITQRNPLQYSQFTNVAGLSIFWDVNRRLSAFFQYDHLNVIALKSELDDLDQSSELFSASATYQIHSGLSVGLQGNASMVKYQNSFLNESTNYDVGATLASRITRSMFLQMIVGYQVGRFGSGGEVGDKSNVDNWHFRASINHQINKLVSHSLSVGHESQIGTASNSAIVDYIRHQCYFTFSKDVGVSTSVSFDSASESGGAFAQDFKLYQLGIFGYWKLARKLSLSLGYSITKRDASSASDDADNVEDYLENRVDLAIQLNL